MSVANVASQRDRGFSWDQLVRSWEELEVSEGWKAEIVEGIVALVPPPSCHHNLIAHRVHRQLNSVIPEEWAVCQTLGVAIPLRSGLYIPDIVVVPEVDVLSSGGTYHTMASHARLVVEITSPGNASHDRLNKAAAYALAGIPLYLLIDTCLPGGPTVTLYGDLENDVYRTLQSVKFGETIHLPEPFDTDIDTSKFPST